MSHAPFSSTRRSRQTAIAAACVLILASAAFAPAIAQDGMTFEQRMIDKMMKGLGATDGTDAGIEYRERSPLVVPPRIDLPPPQQTSAAPAPNWPKDPDVEERKTRAAARQPTRQAAEWEEGRPLSQEELAKGRNPNAAQVRNVPVRREGDRLSSGELGYKGDLFSNLFKGKGYAQETATFKGEPPRTTLTEPPVGYQTPTNGQVYGAGPQVDNTPLPEQDGKPLAPGKF
jgi:hypothetical protein